MFSTTEQLKRRTPENGTDRESFLSLLVDEYLHSSSYDCKCQVLANLSNFAYDPINFGYIRDVGVLDVFLHVVRKESDEKLLQFAIAGICNLCLDPLNAEYIITNLGFGPLKALLKQENSDIIANSITTLLYLNNDKTNTEINTPEVILFMKQVQNTKETKLINLSTIFLEDVCKIN